MLDEKNLLYASASVLTAVFLLYALQNYSIYDQHEKISKKIDLIKIQKQMDQYYTDFGIFSIEIENTSNYTSNLIITGTGFTETHYQFQNDTNLINKFGKLVDFKIQLQLEIKKDNQKEAQLNVLKDSWKTPHKWILGTIIFLGFTVFLVLLSSTMKYLSKNDIGEIFLLTAHFCFAISWVFVLGLSIILTKISF